MDDNDQMPINLPVRATKYVDRRKRPNWIVRIVSALAALGWIGVFVALLFIDKAAPAQENFITIYLGETVIGYWKKSMLQGAFAATLSSFVICIVGLIINAVFHRRKTDRYSKLLIAVSIVSTVILVIYLINFSGYL